MKASILSVSILTLSALFFLSFSGKEKDQIVSLKKFQSFVDSVGLKFEMPENYSPCAVKKNGDLWYGFAMKHDKKDFEVRYSIWSLKTEFEQYEACLKDTSCVMVHPDRIYEGRIQANVLNMTGGQLWEIGPFPDEAVKNEFKADKGGSSFFQFNCEFGKGYEYGQMVYLHKDGIADVIITFMSNDKEKHTENMFEAFYALTFK